MCFLTDPGPVSGPPTVIWAPQDAVSFVQDSDMTLECAAEGIPVPQISWEKYGGHLPVGRFSQILGKWNFCLKWISRLALASAAFHSGIPSIQNGQIKLDMNYLGYLYGYAMSCEGLKAD